MLSLAFEGWFECRLSADPDPADEPRGITGWTSAVAGEPDLDRLIRTQPENAVKRRFAPNIGVTVRSVAIGDQEVPAHPLLGAKIELLDGAVFEGRNGLASEDTEEPIFPFHIRVEANGIRLRREHRDLATGEWAFTKSLGPFGGPIIGEAIGVQDPVAFRQARRAALVEALATETDPVARVALTKRISDIDRLDVFDNPAAPPLTVALLLGGLQYRYVLEGPWFEVADPEDKLGGVIDGSPWVASFWAGGWDADVLCGYMKGRLELPFRAND